MTKKECWKKVKGWNEYSVSTFGRFKRHSTYKRQVANIPISCAVDSHGYEWAYFRAKGKRSERRQLHVVILETFVCSRPIGMETLHYDDVKANNILTNLRWGTRKENMIDMKRNGIKIGFACLSTTARDIAHAKGRETIRRKGIKIGNSALTKKERVILGKKISATRASRTYVSLKGERVGTAKLSAKDIRYMRKFKTPNRIGISGQLRKILSIKFLVSVSTIRNITEGRSWRHIR